MVNWPVSCLVNSSVRLHKRYWRIAMKNYGLFVHDSRRRLLDLPVDSEIRIESPSCLFVVFTYKRILDVIPRVYCLVNLQSRETPGDKI